MINKETRYIVNNQTELKIYISEDKLTDEQKKTPIHERDFQVFSAHGEKRANALLQNSRLWRLDSDPILLSPISAVQVAETVLKEATKQAEINANETERIALERKQLLELKEELERKEKEFLSKRKQKEDGK